MTTGKLVLLFTIGASLMLGLHPKQTLGNTTLPKKQEQEEKPTEEKKKPDENAIKAFSEVITADMKSQKGFINVYEKEGKYFFEIPNSSFNKEILVVNRIAKASADMRRGFLGLAGDNIGEAVYQFEKGSLNKVFLKRISYTEYENDSTKPMYASVVSNNVQAIAEAFNIKAFSPDSSGVVIEVTDFLNSDSDVLYFKNEKIKEDEGMGAQEDSKSYVKFIHAYENNLEIRAFKTYKAGKNKTSNNYSLELNSSMVLLPEVPMQPRIVDERVGYFRLKQRNFNANPQGVENIQLAKRWRLEPKPEDREKYLRGELVEPQKPIVFYIDPATPAKWVPYLIQGVNDWQKAFEKAGFKNAIYAREAPTVEEDSTWSLDNAAYSAIVYRPSEIENAMGPSIADPRTGEIMESHIFWYHNVMKLLRDWYFIQTAAVDTGARKAVFDDELMGELIRFVSSHEVGHTLGLMHNFGSSSTVPVEKLRDKAWVEANGHTPSIMDYARFNYVAQPEDNISRSGLFPRIGDYDNWAIYWGYRWYPQFDDEYEEQTYLAKVVTDSLATNHRLWYGAQGEEFDPRDQNEDLGDNAMLASEYGIKNLQRIADNLLEWTTEDAQDYSNTQEIFEALIAQFNRYMGHVAKNIGGIEHTFVVAGMPEPAFAPTPYDKQKQATAFLNEQLFQTPVWLNHTELFEKVPMTFGEQLAKIQKGIIEQLLDAKKLSNLMSSEVDYANQKCYSVFEFMSDLDKGIFTELYQHKNASFFRQQLQKLFVEQLILKITDSGKPKDDKNKPMVAGPQSAKTLYDSKGILLDQLKTIQALVKTNQKLSSLDQASKVHLADLDHRIGLALELNTKSTTSN
ncbi:zinc-dependent metalloprotease [Mangrovibacterium diazotrophicum]|uniref:Uncharacterized protein DUF5118 n=1 Tax=Mangrovibacterium diazotrophicum TaxID=1261403 RepID=A0A419WBM8_9BACT|nr:zinc-dependent metalloprotease [Mangrovibacterium diazotrophicum]RKD92806.1 uncharacterized protein DUF5118 [Mangrovibacterium diazotrophicum]